MSLVTGTITSETPSEALSDLLKTLVGGSGVANWSFVENIPAGTGDGQSGDAKYSVDVFKCSGSGTDANDCGNDWYTGILRYDTTAVLYQIWAEEYNSEDKTFKGWPHSKVGANNYADITNEYFVGPIYTGNVFSKASILVTNSTRIQYTINTTGFNYWIYLNNNFLVMGLLVGASQYGYYLGLMDSLIDSSITDNLPLVLASTITNNGDANCAIARAPGVTSFVGNTTQATGGVTLFPWTTSAYTGGPYVCLSTGYPDAFFNGGIHASRGFIAHDVDADIIKNVGYARGLLKEEVMVVPYQEITIGDTMSLTDTDATPDSWTVVSGNIDGYVLLVRS